MVKSDYTQKYARCTRIRLQWRLIEAKIDSRIFREIEIALFGRQRERSEGGARAVFGARVSIAARKLNRVRPDRDEFPWAPGPLGYKPFTWKRVASERRARCQLISVLWLAAIHPYARSARQTAPTYTYFAFWSIVSCVDRLIDALFARRTRDLWKDSIFSKLWFFL